MLHGLNSSRFVVPPTLLKSMEDSHKSEGAHGGKSLNGLLYEGARSMNFSLAII